MLNSFCKHIFDLTLAGIGLILSLPLFGLIAALLWLEDHGPVIFSQQRIGRGGRCFRMYKFRKFPVAWGDQGPGVTVTNDARMTRLGSFLERTKLDELPQLWNILKGDMSFVGPRPESTKFADLFVGEYASVLDYTPGLFGPNQIHYRNECDLFPADENPEVFYCRTLFPRKTALDLDYFQQANIFKDTLWILRGVWISLIGIVRWRSFMGLHARIVLCDILMIEIAWLLSHFLRFGTIPVGPQFEYLYQGLYILPLFLIISMLIGGCYRYPAQFFSLLDVTRLSSVLCISWMICFLYMLYFERSISFTLLIAFWFILLPAVTLPRVARRIIKERMRSKKPAKTSRHNIVIYGVEKSGVALATYLKNQFADIHLLGFLDDFPSLNGMHVDGHKVLGKESDIPTINAVNRIDEIWLNFPPDEIKRRRLKKMCHEKEITLIILPEDKLFQRFRYNSP